MANIFKTMISSIVARNMKKKLTNWTIHEEDVTEVLKQIRIALLDADVNLLVVKNFINIINRGHNRLFFIIFNNAKTHTLGS